MLNLEALRIAMVQQRLNISELARRSGVSRQRLHDILDGSDTTVGTLNKIAVVLGKQPALFLSELSEIKHDPTAPTAS